MKGRRPWTGAPASILVLKPSSFGDIVHTLPAVARLKACWPASRITWLVNPEWAPLVHGSPVVDQVLIFPRKEFRGWDGLLRFRRWLRAGVAGLRPDLALDFQGLLRTAFIGRATRPAEFAGMSDAREGARWFYDRVVPVPADTPHSVERYLALSERMAATAGCTPSEWSKGSLPFPLPDGEPPPSSRSLESGYVLLHPFARGADKSLTSAQAQTICAALSPRQVVVIGQTSAPAVQLPPNGLNLLNQTSIPHLIWLVRRAAFVISVDSGPAHLAAALHKKMVAVHTWSDPRRVGPYLPEAWVLKNGELLQVRELPVRDETFFSRSGGHVLTTAQIDAVCALATSL